jgi:iron(III) transport system substrate-binding protein
METFFRALLENDVKVLAGNSVVRDRVASGELEIGLTDTDDVHVALEKGLPLGVVFPDQEGGVWPGLGAPLGTFAIPNTVAIIACGPRPDLARRFVDFLLLPRTEERLARGASAQIPARPGIERPLLLEVPDGLVLMEVPYEDVARGVEESTPFLKRLFAVR